MTAQATIVGDEVIGLPGQHLSNQELNVLVRLADGVPTPIIAQHLDIDPVSMRQVESAIMAKLGARNKVHMITRAFTLGVLIPQALCMLLCIAAVFEIENDCTRPSRHRRDRTMTETSRCSRNSTSPAGGPPLRAVA
jgi:DNA-binding CsgD family transcriptional regulator